MFGKKPAKSIEVTKLSSLIADNVEIVGDIYFTGGLRVDGTVKGSIVCADGEKGLLVVSQSGRIEGDVTVHDAVINGHMSGDLTVDHFLELQPKAHVRGNIRYRQLQMECGAAVEGQLFTSSHAAESSKVIDFSSEKDRERAEKPEKDKTAASAS